MIVHRIEPARSDKLPGALMAGFLEKRGVPVFEDLGIWWGHFSGPFYTSLPSHKEFDPDPDEVREMMARRKIRALRYPTGSNGLVTALYVCRPPEYSLASLSRQYRNQVQRGLGQCEIRKVTPDDLLGQGLRLNLDTMERQRRFDPEFGAPPRWQRFVRAVEESPAVEVTGSFVDGRLSCYVLTLREDGWLHMLFKMQRTDERVHRTSHALDHAILCAAAADPRIEWAESGYARLVPDSGYDQYKRGMGFKLAEMNLAVHLHPAIEPALTGRFGVTAARAAHRIRPGSKKLALAVKVLEGARLTRGAHEVDPCQHTTYLTYSRLWRPYPVFMLRVLAAYWKREGTVKSAHKVFQVLTAKLLPKPPGPAVKAPPRPPAADEVLGLQPGDWVEVRSEEEIKAGLDSKNKHRGMAFVPTEMLVHCGQRYRVLRRVEKVFLEESRQNRTLKNTVLLEGVHCKGNGLDCDRYCFLFWREAWLKKVEPPK